MRWSSTFNKTEERTLHEEITKYKKRELRNDTFYWTGKVRNVMKLNVL